MTFWVTLLVVVVVVGVAGVVLYNRLVQARNRVDNAWGQVDVQLKRRYDLVPNLVETVKGYASHEQETLQAVVEARAAAQAAPDPAAQAKAENVLTGALRQLFALAESYPELRAAPNFADLQTQLSDTENRIAVSRQIYNDSVLTYNNAVQTVPTNLVAGLGGFDVRPFFEPGERVDEPPAVEF
jgi:LemA protein